ncbi:MAG: sodium:proton antiporter NhaD [Desulfobulbus sp.]|nr:sodium:proton antiporter NhaD [Desulfobulbus sp.]
MSTLLVIVFIFAYLAIAMEHPLQVNKSATALVASGLLWTIYALSVPDAQTAVHNLHESLAETSQIVFFLMGAMTIVEVIDAHDGFSVITNRITTTRISSLLWLIGFVTFFLSSILDNLTTTIVMISLLKKLLSQRDDRLLFAGIVIIAANAGGAWTPIGDVTTTMLWIGGQITTTHIVGAILLPSLVCMVVPLSLTAFSLRGRIVTMPVTQGKLNASRTTTPTGRIVMFCLGIGTLVMVPVFKAVTQLPPFMGILFGLGILWMVGEILHRNMVDEEFKEQLSLVAALKRIDLSCITFFVGILLAVSVLEHTHILAQLATWLERTVGREDCIVTLIGLASSVVDNVPLVAASMGMYDMASHPVDSFLWEFLAYCAGTGGSILVIGSAAGVAAMGLEKIEFIWYARRIGFLAVIGYFSGIFVYIVQYRFFH